MKYYTINIIAIALVFHISIEPSLQQCISYYTIKQGDTCYALVQTYGLNEANFYASNGNINCYNLQIGQLVCLRSNTISSSLPQPGYLSSTGYYGCSNPYVIKYGDTCFGLMSQFGIDSSVFYSLNPGISCNLLRIGQTICLTNKYGYIFNTAYGCSNPYTVKSGDTCYQIISYFSQNYQTFFTNNPGINCNLLQIGQVLCLSTTLGSPYYGSNQAIVYSSGYGCANTYTIKAGDTCAGLISNYGLAPSSFYSANPSINCYYLQIGQVVCLGANQGNSLGQSFANGYGCSSTHTVRQGDTCYDIASLYASNLALLYSANPGINCNLLQIGQIICLRPKYGAILPSTTSSMPTSTSITPTILTTTTPFCASNKQCQNFGICLGTECFCANGYKGTYCETFDIGLMTDEASTIPCSFDNPCLNQGTCFEIQNSYRCLCVSTYIGINCEVASSTVAPMTSLSQTSTSAPAGTLCPFQNPCKNSAQCILKNNSYACVCQLGYTGTFCESFDLQTTTTTSTTTTSASMMKPCPFTSPCQNQGICMLMDNSYLCICNTGFMGNFCETKK